MFKHMKHAVEVYVHKAAEIYTWAPYAQMHINDRFGGKL